MRAPKNTHPHSGRGAWGWINQYHSPPHYQVPPAPGWETTLKGGEG